MSASCSLFTTNLLQKTLLEGFSNLKNEKTYSTRLVCNHCSISVDDHPLTCLEEEIDYDFRFRQGT